ncbi:MAG TPA: Holliday junction resolvase RuvX [Blastocatellia bacterium]|nr:Holliday junction resolvase RuvX [Blastocatellia bacterium]
MLAIDLGSKRIGTAVSDELGISVRPVETIRRSTTAQDFARLEQLVEELGVQEIVVGLPLRLDGTAGDAAQKCLAFAEKLRARVRVKVSTQDEKLTSYEAEREMKELGYDSKRRRERSDEFAAMIILRDYLEKRK